MEVQARRPAGAPAFSGRRPWARPPSGAPAGGLRHDGAASRRLHARVSSPSCASAISYSPTPLLPASATSLCMDKCRSNYQRIGAYVVLRKSRYVAWQRLATCTAAAFKVWHPRITSATCVCRSKHNWSVQRSANPALPNYVPTTQSRGVQHLPRQCQVLHNARSLRRAWSLILWLTSSKQSGCCSRVAL